MKDDRNSSVRQSLNPPTSDSQLEKVKAMDEESWRWLKDYYTPLIRWWCRSWQCQGWQLSKEDKEDVTQQVFATVVTKIKDFKKGSHVGGFRAWLREITQNKLRDLGKKRRGKAQAVGGTSATEGIAQVPGPIDAALEVNELSEWAILVQKAMRVIRDQFEPKTWEVFWLVAVEDRDPEAIAEQMAINVATVYTHKCRVLNRLKDEIQKHLGDLEEGQSTELCARVLATTSGEEAREGPYET